MPIETSDSRSNSDKQILHAADLLSKSEDRRKVFREIYSGGKKGKNAEEIAIKTKVEYIRVLQEALVLSKAKIIDKVREKGRLTYIRDDFFSLNRDKILRLAENHEAREKLRKIVYPHLSALQTVQRQPIKLRSTKKKIKPMKILFLAANPKDTVNLRLDEEVREIEHRIMLAQKKEEFTFVKKGAVRVSDLQLYLNQEMPNIVHFSGHGTNDGRIILEDNNGESFGVPSLALARVFHTLKDDINCVMLNTCFSLEQAQAISQSVDCVIGMSSSISDEAAIAFSSAFYLALASARSIKNAFEQGVNELMLLGIPEDSTPNLLIRTGIDPSKVVLVR